jgi:hypothetical protein
MENEQEEGEKMKWKKVKIDNLSENKMIFKNARRANW